MNTDIYVLATKVIALSKLTPAELDSQAWEAMILIGAIYQSATPAGVLAAKADIEARWGVELKAAGPLALLAPRWHVRADDGKPPAVAKALASALDNPARSLAARLAVVSKIDPKEREPLTELVRVLIADAFRGATGPAKVQFVDTMRALSTTKASQPWHAVLPHGQSGPPLQILLDNQGAGPNDGSVFDADPSDDPFFVNAIRTWDVDWLRDNPLAVAYQGTEDAAGAVVDTVAGAGKSAAQVAGSLLLVVKYGPYVLGVAALAGAALTVRSLLRR